MFDLAIRGLRTAGTGGDLLWEIGGSGASRLSPGFGKKKPAGEAGFESSQNFSPSLNDILCEVHNTLAKAFPPH